MTAPEASEMVELRDSAAELSGVLLAAQAIDDSNRCSSVRESDGTVVARAVNDLRAAADLIESQAAEIERLTAERDVILEIHPDTHPYRCPHCEYFAPCPTRRVLTEGQP